MAASSSHMIPANSKQEKNPTNNRWTKRVIYQSKFAAIKIDGNGHESHEKEAAEHEQHDIPFRLTNSVLILPNEEGATLELKTRSTISVPKEDERSEGHKPPGIAARGMRKYFLRPWFRMRKLEPGEPGSTISTPIVL